LEAPFDSTEGGPLQGTLDMLILKALSLGRLDQFQVGVTETGRRAKFYTLTKAGSKQLKADKESRDRLALAIAKVRRAV
jgi:DNA-binding PadR family transcriptional regulator